MYECLVAVAKMMAPVAPFFGEWLFRALNEVTEREEAVSVHLAPLPGRRGGRRLTWTWSGGWGWRGRSRPSCWRSGTTPALNVRQPLPRILVVTGPDVREGDVEAVREVILDEVNVKAIDYVSGASDVVRRSARPNFKRLGRRLGKQMKAAGAAIRDLDGDAIDRYLQEGGLTLQVDGTDVRLEG